jgi:hypothetical protein
MFYKTFKYEDQELEDVPTKKEEMKGNCSASQDPFWFVELL